MHVLLIDAYDPDDADAGLVEQTVAVLERQGHTVEVHHLVLAGFALAMSSDERIAYETDAPLQADETRAAANAVAGADALLFCHPTSMFGVPPVLKGWLDRVLVVGVGFTFNRFGRVSPGMRNIRRLGVVTSTPHGRARTLRARDLTHRTIGRTVWLSCSRRCRQTFIRVPAGSSPDDAAESISRGLRRWAPRSPRA